MYSSYPYTKKNLQNKEVDTRGLYTEQATTGVRKLVQIYNICASVSACVSVTDLCYNFPQGNLAMKPTYQDCKNPMKPKNQENQKNQKNQDCKTHETKKTKKKKNKKNKIARPMRAAILEP